MKVALVVASGAHQGKEIPILGAQFVIGRDEGCNLRPASPAISKKHCAILVRNGKVYIKDLGSTNGTFVNEQQITTDRELQPGDKVKAGPLEFTLSITGRSDSTPLPDQLKAVDSPAAKKLAEATGSKATAPATPNPTIPTKPGSTSAKPVSSKPNADADVAAAMLLSMDDDDPVDPKVPEGSTVMEIPAVDAAKKPPETKKNDNKAESSAAAAELLRNYMRRPK